MSEPSTPQPEKYRDQPCPDEGKFVLLGRLEKILEKHIKKQGDPSRCPVHWPSGRKLRWHLASVLPDEMDLDELVQGRYVFGETDVHVFAALNAMLTYLEEYVDPRALKECYLMHSREFLINTIEKKLRIY